MHAKWCLLLFEEMVAGCSNLELMKVHREGGTVERKYGQRWKFGKHADLKGVQRQRSQREAVEAGEEDQIRAVP